MAYSAFTVHNIIGLTSNVINPWSLSSNYSATDFLEATQRQERLVAMRGRKPPPKFENALKCSTPVSFIQVTDDSPPPTYEEYLAMTRRIDREPTTVVIFPEIHQPSNPVGAVI